MKNWAEELGWEIDVDYPSWGNTEVYVKTISKKYYFRFRIRIKSYVKLR